MTPADRDPPKRHPPSRTSLQDVRTRLAAFISERGLKQSRQREVVAEAFFAMPGHVSAEELAERVRGVDRRVSVATVYRTLKLLGESGLAIPRNFGEGQTRWEASLGRTHHDHLICTVCGAIVEFANEEIERLQALVARRHAFEVESHRLELYGRCGSCRGRGGEGKGSGEERA
ncbi:MAG TPA: transcriptional repressor [Anaeromyxobacteraceae bacterium]|nr:transcriptional repressor [Anaeromyxobacteraceae bacterium]